MGKGGASQSEACSKSKLGSRGKLPLAERDAEEDASIALVRTHVVEQLSVSLSVHMCVWVTREVKYNYKPNATGCELGLANKRVGPAVGFTKASRFGTSK